jgi:streptomycin 3"-adenylyltransferase
VERLLRLDLAGERGREELVEVAHGVDPIPSSRPECCVEVTAVAQAQVRPWRYPPGFDLRYGEWLRSRFERGIACCCSGLSTRNT